MSTRGSVDISKIGDEIWKVVDEWSIKASVKMSDSVLATAKESKNEIEKATPKGAGRIDGKSYRQCFTIKPNAGNSKAMLTRTLWNTQYQLSHLLEDGHNVYTRTGKKSNPNAKKIGPLAIKRRSAKNGGNFVMYKNNKTTASYNMWNHAQEFAEDYLYKDLKNRLEKL